MKLIDLVTVLQGKAVSDPDLVVSALVFEAQDGRLVFANVAGMDKKTGDHLVKLIKTMSR